MNIRLVMYLLGKLSIACAVAMVVPMITALLLGNTCSWALSFLL